VEPVFEQYKSFILASIHFSKLTLGTVAPQFTGRTSIKNLHSLSIDEWSFFLYHTVYVAYYDIIFIDKPLVGAQELMSTCVI
jgi:hypothetical protein